MINKAYFAQSAAIRKKDDSHLAVETSPLVFADINMILFATRHFTLLFFLPKPIFTRVQLLKRTTVRTYLF